MYAEQPEPIEVVLSQKLITAFTTCTPITITQTLNLLNELMNDFGGNEEASVLKSPIQLMSFYKAKLHDDSQLQNLRAAKAEIEKISQSEAPQHKGFAILKVICELLGKSRSENWTAGIVMGGVQCTAPSLNNMLSTKLLQNAGWLDASVSGALAMRGKEFRASLESKTDVLIAAYAVAGITDSITPPLLASKALLPRPPFWT